MVLSQVQYGSKTETYPEMKVFGMPKTKPNKTGCAGKISRITCTGRAWLNWLCLQKTNRAKHGWLVG